MIRASIAIAVVVGLGTVPMSQPGPPSRMAAYLTDVVKLSPQERTQLAAGQPVTRLLPSDESKEVAVFGAIWIDAPLQRYVEAVRDIENFERGAGFRVTKRISTPPQLSDFAGLDIPSEDFHDLRTCRVGSCEVKLGEDALVRFRSQVPWGTPEAREAANRLMRQLAFEYVTGYLEGGNARLAVYRDRSRPTFVAAEFQTTIDAMPELTTFMPSVRRYLLEYPKFIPPGTTSFLYWQEAEFGLKRTLRISHLSTIESPDGAVVVSKMLYASHYFWTGVELRVLLADPSRGPGFWLVTVSRSRSDGLGGFTGTIIRGRVRSEVERGTRAALESTRQRLE